MERETKITVGQQEIVDLQFAIRCALGRLNASNFGDDRDWLQLTRLVNTWVRLEYIRTHDEKGALIHDV